MKQAASNEGKCCDAVLKVIEARTGQARANVSVDRPGDRGVEIECTVGDTRFAIEHTLIEPYQKKIRDDQVLQIVMDPVVAKLRCIQNLPLDTYYHVAVDAGALAAYRGKHSNVSDQILRWAEVEIHNVPIPEPGRTTGINATICDPPIRVSIICWQLPRAGPAQVSYMRTPPYRLEDERYKRIREACDKKLPKLLACARRGMRTVLVFENPDIALTGFTVVGAALEKCLRERAPEFEPDEVYQVDTSISGMWVVYPLRRDRQPWSAFDYDDDHRFPQFDSATLVDITTGSP